MNLFFPLNTPFELRVRNAKTLKEKDVTILADRKIDDSERWVIHNFSNMDTNFFYHDKKQKISYIRIVENSSRSADFFTSHLAEMDQSITVILDLSEDRGGQSPANVPIYDYLINKDTVYSYYYTTRSHFSLMKGMGQDYCLNRYEVPQETKDIYCSYYKGTAYLPLSQWNSNDRIIDTVPHFQGNVYVIIGSNCVSAGEELAAMLSQDERILFFGSKTGGAVGRPYNLYLPSGLEIFIETAKSYNFQQEDISTGINPHYFVDFYDCYQTSQPAELLKCITEKINQALKK